MDERPDAGAPTLDYRPSASSSNDELLDLRQRRDRFVEKCAFLGLAGGAIAFAGLGAVFAAVTGWAPVPRVSAAMGATVGAIAGTVIGLVGGTAVGFVLSFVRVR